MKYYPEGYLIGSKENNFYLNSAINLSEACKEKKIVEARAIVCDSGHNIVVDLGAMKGIIPREEGAIGIKDGSVRDIAIISRVNKPVSFIVTDFRRDEKGTIYAVLSRRLAQEQCRKNYIDNLIPGDVITAKITHIEAFGVFADIGCGIIALMPIDFISVSRIEHPSERFSVGMEIKTVIKSKENGRITLSQKELLGTWEENSSIFKSGETVAGIIRSVENYGVFVELTPNLAGLAELKDGVFPGQQASVYIKCIVPSRMKIKLIIIETFDYVYNPTPPKYFFIQHHMDKFVYSPTESEKIIVSEF
ncbi:MAG: S1 RNA-binding domain-containing protein [Clostridia bacterium]